MTGALNVFGLYLPWLMPLAAFSLLLLWAVRRLLALSGAYRWIWHPALFDMALYVLLLWAVSDLSTTSFGHLFGRLLAPLST